MPIKDRVVTWWIQNVIIPRQEIIDKPGFVVTTFTEKNQTTYLRDFFLPEQLFEIIENKIVEEHGDMGKQALYSAGKKFGYLYASMSNFPTINNCSRKDFLEFAYLLVRYIEGTFAQRAEHDVNIEEKQFTIFFDNYIICRHNGLGYIMTDGGIAGIWAYAIQDKFIEGIQLECQGRGSERCFIICAPEKKILEKTNTFFHEKNLLEYKSDIVYKKMNEIRETIYAKNSLKNLIDVGFFEFQQGVLSYKNMRFFVCESQIFYLLEQELSNLKNGEQILFNACVEYGKFLQETYGNIDYEKFILDFFPALGFGEIIISKLNNISISASYYPWTIFSDQSKFIIFRGIMSGFISSCLGKHIEFKNYKIDITDFLTLTITV